MWHKIQEEEEKNIFGVKRWKKSLDKWNEKAIEKKERKKVTVGFENWKMKNEKWKFELRTKNWKRFNHNFANNNDGIGIDPFPQL